MPEVDIHDTSVPIETRIPLVAQVRGDLRGEDLADLGKDINEWVVSNRKARKDFADLDTKHKALLAEHDKLKAQPKYAPLAADAKPEEIAAYHKAYGVPEKPEDYKYTLAEGMPSDVLDEDTVKGFYEFAHKRHLPQSIVNDLLNFEVQNVVEARKFLADEINAKAKETQEALVKQYGAQDAKVKVEDALKALAAFFPESFMKRIMDKEHPDPIGNDLDFINGAIKLSELVKERGILPAGDGSGTKAGEPDYAKLYPASFAKGYMHK